MKQITLTQNLYRWAITQILATRKFDIILQALVKYNIRKYETVLASQLAAANPKDKKGIARIKRDYDTEVRGLKKDFADYSQLNKRMVKRFAEIDDNILLQLAADKMDKFLNDNVEITKEA